MSHLVAAKLDARVSVRAKALVGGGLPVSRSPSANIYRLTDIRFVFEWAWFIGLVFCLLTSSGTIETGFW